MKIGNGEFLVGDCLDLMLDIPDGSVDMVLCDLPYGTTQNKWDSVLPLEELWTAYNRICRGAVVLTASQPFTSILVISNLAGFGYDLVWNKNKSSGFLNAKKRQMRKHETILVFNVKAAPYNPQMSTGHAPGNAATRRKHSQNYGIASPFSYGGSTTRYPTSVLDFSVLNNDSPDRIHPTQKPVALFEYLIKTYSNSGDVVLDNTAGSGTTAIAAENCGRRWICIEQDQTYADKAIDRIKGHVPQMDLLAERVVA